MAIPAFRLPSNQKIMVQFREANVNDCLKFCNSDDRFDEQLTTRYLNAIQEGEVNDSADWTAQDRRAALWWIFVTTSADTTIVYSYPCNHCGTEHIATIDLVDLDQEAVSLNRQPFIDDTALFNDQERKIRLHPYTGRAMEQMERVNIERSNEDPESDEYKLLTATLKLYEIANAFDFEDTPADFEEALNAKMDAIKAMKRTSELPLLVAAIEAAQETLHHGLAHSFNDGQLFLLSPELQCSQPKEGQAAGVTRLLLPFQGKLFIPEI